MTDKEKAIKYFNNIAWETNTSQQHGITGEFMLVNDVRGEECDYLRNYLTKPTLDDAIAVVEEYAERYNDLHDVVLLTEVLLALKGLKEVK